MDHGIFREDHTFNGDLRDTNISFSILHDLHDSTRPPTCRETGTTSSKEANEFYRQQKGLGRPRENSNVLRRKSKYSPESTPEPWTPRDVDMSQSVDSVDVSIANSTVREERGDCGDSDPYLAEVSQPILAGEKEIKVSPFDRPSRNSFDDDLGAAR